MANPLEAYRWLDNELAGLNGVIREVARRLRDPPKDPRVREQGMAMLARHLDDSCCRIEDVLHQAREEALDLRQPFSTGTDTDHSEKEVSGKTTRGLQFTGKEEKVRRAHGTATRLLEDVNHCGEEMFQVPRSTSSVIASTHRDSSLCTGESRKLS